MKFPSKILETSNAMHDFVAIAGHETFYRFSIKFNCLAYQLTNPANLTLVNGYQWRWCQELWNNDSREAKNQTCVDGSDVGNECSDYLSNSLPTLLLIELWFNAYGSVWLYDLRCRTSIIANQRNTLLLFTILVRDKQSINKQLWADCRKDHMIFIKRTEQLEKNRKEIFA